MLARTALLLAALLAALAALAPQPAATLTPLAQNTFVQRVNGVPRDVHVLTVRCGPENQGRNNLTVVDDASGRRFQVEVNCQPPQYEFDTFHTADTVRDVWVSRHTTCRTSQLTVSNRTRAEFQKHAPHEVPHRRAAAAAAGHRNVSSQGLVAGFVGGAVGGAVYCGITGCGGGGGAELAAALDEVRAASLAAWEDQYTWNERQIAFNEGQTRFNDGLLDRQQQIAAGVSANSDALRRLSGGLQGISDFATGFAEYATSQLKSVRDGVEGNMATLNAVGDAVLALNNQTENELRRLYETALANSRGIAGTQNADYRVLMNFEDRRAATARFYEAAAADPAAALGLESTLFVQDYHHRPPRTAVQLNLDFHSLHGAVLVATASAQGTVQQADGKWLALQLDYELYVDPVWFADNYVPGAGINDLLTRLGGDREGGQICTTPPANTNGSEPMWNCRSVLVMNGHACELKDQSRVFPWDFPEAADGIDLSRDYETGFVHPECRRWTGTPYGGRFGRDGSPPAVHTRASAFYAALQQSCETPAGGSWVQHAGSGAHVRMARMDSTRYQDLKMADGTNGFSDYCNGDVNAFQTGDNNLKRYAYYVMNNLRNSYSESGVFNTAQRELEMFGALPGNLTYQHDAMSLDPFTNAVQDCTTVIVPRVLNSGDLDREVLRLRRWNMQGQPRPGGSVRVFEEGAGLVTPDVLFQDYAGAGGGSVDMSRASGARFQFAVESQISDANTARLPHGKLLLEDAAYWSRYGVVFDVPYADLSDSGTANARRGKASYILSRRFLNGTSQPLSSAKHPRVFSMEEWHRQNQAQFHADSIGDGAQLYARVYDPASGCGNSQKRDGVSDAGTAQPDNDLCSMLEAFRVVHGAGQSVHTLVPRGGWSSLMTFRVPGGIFETSSSSACPVANVTVAGGRAVVSLGGTPGQIEQAPICAVVVGVRDLLVDEVAPECTRAVQRRSVPAYGSGTTALDAIESAVGQGCVAQYLQLWPAPPEYGSACPPSDTLLGGGVSTTPCFQGTLGLSLQTSRAVVAGDSYSGSATQAHVTRAIDREFEMIQRLARAQDSAAAAIQRAYWKVGADTAAITTELQRELAENEARVRALPNIDEARIQSTIDALRNQTAETVAQVDTVAGNVSQSMGTVLDDVKRARADNLKLGEEIEELQRLNGELAQSMVRLNESWNRAIQAARELDDHGGLFGGLLEVGGFLGDLAGDLIDSPLSGIWSFFDGIMQFLLPFILLALLICFAPQGIRTFKACLAGRAGAGGGDGGDSVGGHVQYARVSLGPGSA